MSVQPGVLIPLDEERLAAYLPQQRWFGAKDRRIESVEIESVEALAEDWPRLVRAVVAVDAGGATLRYQLFVGARPVGEPLEFLHGNEQAVLGEVSTADGDAVAYDAVFDHQLALCLLPRVVPGETAAIVRVLGAEQSNTSLVYDDRIILKLFRQLAEGPNPDVEVTSALGARGFAHVAAPLGVWRDGGRDLAVAQPFLAGAADGWQLALTSLRDALTVHDTSQMPVINVDAPPPEVGPGDAGGDFAAEAERLGATTAALHVALGDAFGRQAGDAGAWAEPMRAQLARTGLHEALDRERVAQRFDAFAALDDPGPAIRIHGDYHLGQVLRSDDGWYVLDFEGEPARPLAERTRHSSPLKDVAGMLRSFHYASQVALREHQAVGVDEDADEMAAAWEARNREAFLTGYVPIAQEAGLLSASWQTLLVTFELDKAVYELAYEMGNRPAWVPIPVSAIRRILETS